jgi:Domain of unknown function (DUF4936)
MSKPTPADGCELYVYYRVCATDSAAVAQEVLAAHQRLMARWPQLETRLLQREEGPTTTWMEIYRHPQGLDAPLLDQVRQAMAALPTQRDGPRHEERFVPCTLQR